MMPALTPCKSSPPAGGRSRTTTSATSSMASSDWPAPTLSTMTTSWPAHSQSATAACVCAATPPRWPFAGDGRTKVRRPSSGMRARSPRMEPPSRRDDGSIARTATPSPPSRSRAPSASTKDDLPTPGGPQTPRRSVRRLGAGSAARSASASAQSSARDDSTRVTARARAARDPASTPSSTSCVSGWRCDCGRRASDDSGRPRAVAARRMPRFLPQLAALSL
mmetsp:Transcript_19185/g.66513  ORF Transcript_19185/g.66513 Transcript_19185/m.66513 type:complete len:222 (+) Transcript_19185:26-691(+)